MIITDYPGEVDGRRINPHTSGTYPPLTGLYSPPLEGLIKSDGGQTAYYHLPSHATELRHLISYKNMSKSRGDIFKACWRLGAKDGASVLYDLNKMKFFCDDLLEMHKRGEHL